MPDVGPFPSQSQKVKPAAVDGARCYGGARRNKKVNCGTISPSSAVSAKQLSPRIAIDAPLAHISCRVLCRFPANATASSNRQARTAEYSAKRFWTTLNIANPPVVIKGTNNCLRSLLSHNPNKSKCVCKAKIRCIFNVTQSKIPSEHLEGKVIS